MISRVNDIMYHFCILQVKYPSWLSPDAKSLLEGLFRKNPMERLGGGPNDARAIMEHPFFRTLSWTDLVQKKVRRVLKAEYLPSFYIFHDKKIMVYYCLL